MRKTLVERFNTESVECFIIEKDGTVRRPDGKSLTRGDKKILADQRRYERRKREREARLRLKILATPLLKK